VLKIRNIPTALNIYLGFSSTMNQVFFTWTETDTGMIMCSDPAGKSAKDGIDQPWMVSQKEFHNSVGLPNPVG
jgi:hypothetical protein